MRVMRKCKIDHALDRLNASRGVKYPDIGYSYFADLFGGRPRHVYTIINAGGGVTYASVNGATPRATLRNIEHELTAH